MSNQLPLASSSNPHVTVPYASPSRQTTFRPSVLTSDVHNEAEIIFHILEHKEKRCVSKLDMLTLLRGMGMNPTDGDLDSLHASMQPLISEYEEMVREEERRKERERKKMEAKQGGPKSTNPVKDKADREKKKLDDIKKANASARSAGGGGRSTRPSTAATGDSKDDDGKNENGKEDELDKDGKKKKKSKLDPPEEIKNVDWHIFMHCVEPIFKDARQEEKELMQAFAVFDPDGVGSMSMKQLIEIATQNGESVLSPAEVKMLKEAFPENRIDFRDFTKKLLGTYVPPPPPTAEELAAKARAAAEQAKKEKEAAALNVDNFVASMKSGGADASASPASQQQQQQNQEAAPGSPLSGTGGGEE